MAMGDLARQDEYSPDDNWFADALAAQNAARGSFEGWRRPATDPEGPPTQWEMARRVATGAAPIPTGNAEGAMGLLLGMGRAGDTMADTAADVGRAVPAGVALGLEHGAWMGSLLSHDPSDREAVTEGFAHAREAMPWMAYDPQTAPGRYAREIASVMGNPINWAGPGGAAVKASWNTLSGIGSETLGNMYKGTPYERAARLVGGWTPLGAEWGSRALMRAVPEGAAGALGGRLKQPTIETPVSKGEQVANVPETVVVPPKELLSARYLINPQRDFAPAIYQDPREIARAAAANTVPEHPALKYLFGVNRDDLWQIGGQGTRKGNVEPQIWMPAKGRGSEAAEAAMTPANAQRIIDTLAEARKYPELARGMEAWYVMDPAYHEMVRLFGPERALTEYRRFNASMTPFSAGSPVPLEITRGTAARMMYERGSPASLAFQRYGGFGELNRAGEPNFPAALQDVPAHVYHRTQADPALRYLETGSHGYDKDTVKIPLYTQASGVPQTGFQTKLPVPDTHFATASGLPDVRRSADPGGYMSGAEFRSFGPWYTKNVAEPLGIEAVPAQALQWGAYAPFTGVDTAVGAPKLELIAKNIWDRAQKLGIDPRILRDQVLRGEAHATWLLPTVGLGMGALARQDRQGDYQ